MKVGLDEGNAPPGGSLSQTFRSVVGTTYIMTLELAQLGSGPSGNNAEQLGAGALAGNGSILATNSFVPPTDAWAPFHLGFVATTTNTTIVLTDISPNTDDVDLGRDDVVVETNSPPGPLHPARTEIMPATNDSASAPPYLRYRIATCVCPLPLLPCKARPVRLYCPLEGPSGVGDSAENYLAVSSDRSAVAGRRTQGAFPVTALPL